MPNTASHPSASSERTRDCAPLTRTGAPTGGAGLGGCVGLGMLVGLGISLDRSLGVAVVIVLPYFIACFLAYTAPGIKKPSPPGRAQARVGASTSVSSSDD